ncbi:Ascochitine biosynthesis cluster MFS transporter [Ascochyta lentis]
MNLDSRDPEAQRDVGLTKNTSSVNIPLESVKTDKTSNASPIMGPGEGPKIDDTLVSWSGPDDPQNPQNMPQWKKWVITWLLSFLNVWVTFSSTIFASAVRTTSLEYGVSRVVMTLGVSLTVLGFAVGPLIWGPMSEVIGRLTPFYFGYAVFCIFQIPVGVAQNVYTILICRFFIGFFGTSAMAVTPGVLADIFSPKDRGVAVSVYAAAAFIGPIFGPIVGGFVVDSSLGRRWTAWITLILASAFGLAALLFVPETYGPIILQRRAARLRQETRNFAYHSALDENPPTLNDILFKYFLRPFQMLIKEPILLLVTLYISLVYGVLYLFFVAYPIEFLEVRRWTHAGVAALPLLAVMLGTLAGCLTILFVTGHTYPRKMAKMGRVPPEERLKLMMVGSVSLPIGLFWFGWTSSRSVHWFAQTAAGFPIGIGLALIWVQGLSFLIDVYLMFANSALAGNTLIRSAVGAAFPLFGAPMYHKLGVNWASSLLGFLSVAMIPIPVAFYYYGPKIRAMSKFSPKL